MMYYEKLAVAIKCNKRVLREHNDTVYLPFGEEYSIFIKNLNSVRAQARVEIDGRDIADGTSFIIRENSSIEIERFLRNGNRDAGNRFKFIEHTSQIEEHRGLQVEDGLIRVEFMFEREKVPMIAPVYPMYVGSPVPPVWIPQGPYHYWNSHQPNNNWNSYNPNTNSHTLYSSGESTPHENAVIGNVNSVGITAPGSISNQQFSQACAVYSDGVKHAMIIRMMGEVGQNRVSEPITVKTKTQCTTCNRLNKTTHKFCVECGTSLVII